MSTAASPFRFDVGPVVVMGVSGSGKSLIGGRLAEALSVPFIEGDGLHPERNVAKMAAGEPLTDEDRGPWLDRVGARIFAASAASGGAVAACSALKRVYRDRLRRVAGSALRFIFLEGSRELLEERMTARKHHFMPASLLDSQFATLEPPEDEPGVLTIAVDAPPDEIVARSLRWLETKRRAAGGPSAIDAGHR